MDARSKLAFLAYILLSLLAFACGSSDAGGGPSPGEVNTNTASKLISAAQGGRLDLNQASLVVPAGALATDTLLTVSTATPGASLPDASSVKGMVYEFGPSGTTFGSAATLTLPASGAPAEGKALVISWLDEVANAWVDLASSQANGAVVASVAHFTRFAVRSVASGSNPKPVSRIELSDTLLTLGYDEERDITAKVLAADGTVVPGAKVLWVSDNEESVTVDGGKVAQGDVVTIQAVGRGGAALMATVDGVDVVRSTLILSVPYAPVAKVEVTSEGGNDVLSIGLTRQLTAKAYDPRGHDITAGRIFFWESSNSSILSVDDNGLVKGYSPGGLATVTASCEDLAPNGDRTQPSGSIDVVVEEDLSNCNGHWVATFPSDPVCGGYFLTQDITVEDRVATVKDIGPDGDVWSTNTAQVDSDCVIRYTIPGGACEDGKLIYELKSGGTCTNYSSEGSDGMCTCSQQVTCSIGG